MDPTRVTAAVSIPAHPLQYLSCFGSKQVGNMTQSRDLPRHPEMRWPPALSGPQKRATRSEQNPHSMEFNVSHSAGLALIACVACGIQRGPGLEIETSADVETEAIAERFFSSQEGTWLKQSVEEPREVRKIKTQHGGGEMEEDITKKALMELRGTIEGKELRRSRLISKLIGARCEVEDVLLSSSASSILSSQERFRLCLLMAAIDNIVRRVEHSL